MTDHGTIIEFPGGRRRTDAVAVGSRSVADLTESLSRQVRARRTAMDVDAQLSIRLADLTGVADRTIRRLTFLVHAGSITAASAARLAMRHADEVRGRRRVLGPVGEEHPGRSMLEVTLIGDPFGNFALGFRQGEAWVGFAPFHSLSQLFELCPPGQGPVCLLVGCDACRRTTVRCLDSPHWRQRLSALRSPPRQHAASQVIVLGGLPTCRTSRASVLHALDAAVRRGTGGALIPPMRHPPQVRGIQPSRSDSTRILLMLIELARPGLVDVERADEEPLP